MTGNPAEYNRVSFINQFLIGQQEHLTTIGFSSFLFSMACKDDRDSEQITNRLCRDRLIKHKARNKGAKKSRSNKNSYRGITLLPVLNKLFERYMHDRMDNKLQKMKFPPALQFAGKKGSNSLLTSYCVQEMIHSTMEKHSKVFSAFLDLEKWFDKVWWDGLLFKLLFW